VAGRSRLKPTFFESPAAFRNWLEKNHDKAAELLVGFYKKGSGKPSICFRRRKVTDKKP